MNRTLWIDGGQHTVRQAQDATRTAWLEEQGFRLLRFWNNDVMNNRDGVLQRILEALQEN